LFNVQRTEIACPYIVTSIPGEPTSLAPSPIKTSLRNSRTGAPYNRVLLHSIVQQASVIRQWLRLCTSTPVT